MSTLKKITNYFEGYYRKRRIDRTSSHCSNSKGHILLEDVPGTGKQH